MRIGLPLATLALLTVLRLSMAAESVSELDALHTFAASTGGTIKARVLLASGDNVTIQREDGRQFTLKLAAFAADDQAFIKHWMILKATPGVTTNANVTLQTMNTSAGQPLFSDLIMWEEKPEDIAARLKWPQETNTKFVASFRRYPGDDYRLFGARPYSAVLYADEGKTTSISLVYANKGDLFGKEKVGGEKIAVDRSHATKLEDAMDADVAAITDVLTKALGAPKQQRFGDGVGRRTVSRWDWKGHAFLLQNVGGEYVALVIEEIGFVEAGGKTARVPQALIRTRAKENIERRPNGDVVIANVPMVDQGPKGYCVPATCERAMRYVGLPADMYILAMAGKSGLGGGTSFSTLFGSMKVELQGKSRSISSWKGAMTFPAIAFHIEAGLPIIWGLYSTPPYNQIANERTKERKTTTDWAAWKVKMRDAAKSASLSADETHAHAALIIGYNKDTGEIAVSDSWGPRAVERWVTMAEAEQVSQHEFFVIGL